MSTVGVWILYEIKTIILYYTLAALHPNNTLTNYLLNNMLVTLNASFSNLL